MRINKLMALGAVLAALLFAGSSFAADAAKPEAKAGEGKETTYKAMPKAEHEKKFPAGHPSEAAGGLSQKRCYFDEKEGMYFCAY